MDESILNDLEILYPSIDSEVLEVLLKNAKAFVSEYCDIEGELPESLEHTLLLMIREDITKIGSEALSSESAGGASLSYLTDYSDKVYKVLKRHRKFRFL